jgi:2-C-methyl-D-erythritol 4-phosphate cytidylyltransferase
MDAVNWYWNDFDKHYRRLSSEPIIETTRRCLARATETDKLVVKYDNESIQLCERSELESMFKSEFQMAI